MDENIREERVEELENTQAAEAEAVQPVAEAEAVQPAAEVEAVQPTAEPEAAPVEAVAEDAPVVAEAAPKQGFGGVKNLVQSFIQKVGKKAAIAIAAAVGVVVIGGVAAAAAAGGSPVNSVFKGAQKTVESVESVELVTVLDEILNGGSIEVSMNTEGVSEGYLDMDVVAKIYMDLKESKLAFYANAAMDGSDLADATLWVDERHYLSVCWCGLLLTSPRSRVNSRALLSGPAYCLGSTLAVTEMSLTSAWRCQCSGE